MKDVSLTAKRDQCYGQLTAAHLKASATDNSNILPLVTMTVATYPVDEDFKFKIGATVVTVTATDQSGATDANHVALMSTCTFTVTVNDLQKPDIKCPAADTASTALVPSASGIYDNSGCPVTNMMIVDEDGVTVDSNYVFMTGEARTLTLKITDCHKNTRECQIYTTVPGRWRKQWNFEQASTGCSCKGGDGCAVEYQNVCFIKAEYENKVAMTTEYRVVGGVEMIVKAEGMKPTVAISIKKPNGDDSVQACQQECEKDKTCQFFWARKISAATCVEKAPLQAPPGTSIKEDAATCKTFVHNALRQLTEGDQP